MVSDFCVFGVYVLCCTEEGCEAPHVMKLQFLSTVIQLVRKLKCSKKAIINPSIRQDKCLGGDSAVPFLLCSREVWGVPWQLEATELGCRERGPQRRERTHFRNRHRQGGGRGAF